MRNLGISQQTLQEFLDAPFGEKNNQKGLKYENRYQSYKRKNKIKVVASIEFEENYFLHLKVPSESNDKELMYDVVVQFFTPNEKIKKELSVQNYYVQFFSNSPGFMYKYAALYKLEGYLIEALSDKFAPGMLQVLPDKANKSYELFYDSTIYYACRYLLDHKLKELGKLNIKIFNNKSTERFFADVADTDTVGVGIAVSNIKSKVLKEIKKDTKLSYEQETKLKRNKKLEKDLLHKKNKKYASTHTSAIDGASKTPRISKNKKINPKNTTRKNGS